MWFFRKRANKGQKRAKNLKIYGKLHKIWKFSEKEHMTACNYHMQQTPRLGPDSMQGNMVDKNR